MSPNEPYRRLNRLSHEQNSAIRGFQINCDAPKVVAVDVAGRPVMTTLGRCGSKYFALRRDGSMTDPIEPLVHLLEEDVHDDDCELVLPLLTPED